MSRKPTEAEILRRWEQDWKEAEDSFGSPIPVEHRRTIEERHRALECVRTWEGGSLRRHLSHLMVREDLAEEMIEQFEDVEQAIVEEGQKAERPRQAGGSKIEEAIGWLWSNRGRIFSIEEACQETEISHMTIRKAIQASPDLAVKVGRGRFQIPSEAA